MSLSRKALLTSLLLISAFASGCSSSSVFTLEKPTDTNLPQWITQEVSAEDKAKMTLIPNYLGGKGEYLDGAYSPLTDETSGEYALPLVHVSYLLTGYPDTTAEGNYVTAIAISDPAITVYGLTMASTQDEVTARMKALGFSLDCEECTGDARGWYMNNVYFFLGSTKIAITAQ